MKPMGIIAQARQQSGSLRGLTGAGEPGLYTLLGGTGIEQDSSGHTTMGGAGQVSSTAKLAVAYKDVRLRQVASGQTVSGNGGSSGGGGSTTGPGTKNPGREI